MLGFIYWSALHPRGWNLENKKTTFLEDVLLIDNNIELNPSPWESYYSFSPGGFYFEQGKNRDVEKIYMIRNKINYVGNSNISGREYATGLEVSENAVEGIKIKDLYFLNNTIQNSFGPAIRLSDLLEKTIISGNTIINAASTSGTLSDNSRVGILLGDTLNKVQISHNTFTDNEGTTALKQVIGNRSNNKGNGFYYNNSTNISSAIPFYNHSSASGSPWISTLTKPLVYFSTDSIAIARGTKSTQLSLKLSSPATSQITVTIYKHDVMNRLPNSFTLGQNQVVFSVGESSKPIEITALNNNINVKDLSSELIISYTDGGFPGAMQHCKLQLVDEVPTGSLTPKDSKASFFLYPTPAQDRLFIGGISSENGTYEITSVQGRLVQSGPLGEQGISIQNLPAGLYTIKLTTYTGTGVQKFFKQ
jgi:hypothetical protein